MLRRRLRSGADPIEAEKDLRQDGTVGYTMSRAAIDIGDTVLYNGAAEFWPDIDHWLQRRF